MLSSGPDVSPCREGADRPKQAPLEVCGSLFCETGTGRGPQHSAMFMRPRHPNGEVSHHNQGLRCCCWVWGWRGVRGVGGKETGCSRPPFLPTAAGGPSALIFPITASPDAHFIYSFLILAVPQGMQDLSSLAGDGACTPCTGSMV